MATTQLDEFLGDFALLIEAGFVAVKQLDETSATRIFHAAQAMSPRSVAPQIGLGYIHLNKLEIKEATRIFQQIVDVEPTNELAQVFLGICFLLTRTKRKKGKKVIEEILEKTSDETVKNLAKLALVWSEKDLEKKEKPSFFLSNQEEGGDE